MSFALRPLLPFGLESSVFWLILATEEQENISVKCGTVRKGLLLPPLRRSFMITAENIFDNFKFTMSGLEKGLQIIHITTPAAQLLCCQHDEDITTVLTRSDLKPFDQIPIKKRDTIIGLLKKRECPEEAKGPVIEYMQPLGEKILVSADTPLLEFIQDDPLDRIVIGGTKIYGLVTRSDLLKPPVSLLGFALITHAETLMLNIIRSTRISDERWLTWIPKQHKDEVQRLYKRLKSNLEELDKLGLTYISDKSEILRKLAALEKFAALLPSDTFFIDKLEGLSALRNSIAHPGKVSENDDILQEFIDRLRDTHTWIEGIEQWQTTHANTTHSYIEEEVDL